MQPPVSRRNFLRIGATGAAAGVLAWTGHAQPPAAAPAPGANPAARSRSGAEFINQDTQDKIDRGLELLARSQLSDGSFSDRLGGAAVGVTSLAALALMAAGNQPGRGKYGKNVSRAVDYVAAMANGPNPGFLTTPDSQLTGRPASQPAPKYSPGFAQRV